MRATIMNPTKVLAMILATLVCSAHILSHCQTQELLPSDMVHDDVFGTSVSIDGDWAIVGEHATLR
jgi:hypothetical protein